MTLKLHLHVKMGIEFVGWVLCMDVKTVWGELVWGEFLINLQGENPICPILILFILFRSYYRQKYKNI